MEILYHTLIFNCVDHRKEHLDNVYPYKHLYLDLLLDIFPSFELGSSFLEISYENGFVIDSDETSLYMFSALKDEKQIPLCVVKIEVRIPLAMVTKKKNTSFPILGRRNTDTYPHSNASPNASNKNGKNMTSNWGNGVNVTDSSSYGMHMKTINV